MTQTIHSAPFGPTNCCAASFILMPVLLTVMIASTEAKSRTASISSADTKTLSDSNSEELTKTKSASVEASVEVSRTLSDSLSEEASSSDSHSISSSVTRFDYRLHISCPQNITAGTVLTCTVVATFNDEAIGTEACLVRMVTRGCDTAHVLSNATLHTTGTFLLSFVPTVAGRLSLTASYNYTLTANTTVVVKPAAIVLSRSDSKCAVVEASGTTSVCTAFWRDRFGNVAKTCNTTYEHGAASDQATAVCSVL